MARSPRIRTSGRSSAGRRRLTTGFPLVQEVHGESGHARAEGQPEAPPGESGQCHEGDGGAVAELHDDPQRRVDEVGDVVDGPEDPALERVYGLRFMEFRPLDAGGPLSVGALEGEEVDVALLFTSDGHLKGDQFVLLEEDRGLQPPEILVPVVRREVADRLGAKHPGRGPRQLIAAHVRPDRAQPPCEHRRREAGAGRRRVAPWTRAGVTMVKTWTR